MPQSYDEHRKRYEERFGDIGPEHAMKELESRGYAMTHDHCWLVPLGHTPTEEESFWIDFLWQEWDFGDIALYWCNTHQRRVTAVNKNREPECDPSLGDITTPCRVVCLTDEVETEEGGNGNT